MNAATGAQAAGKIVDILSTFSTLEAAGILTAAVRILDASPRVTLAPILAPAELATVARFGIHDIDLHRDRFERHIRRGAVVKRRGDVNNYIVSNVRTTPTGTECDLIRSNFGVTFLTIPIGEIASINGLSEAVEVKP